MKDYIKKIISSVKPLPDRVQKVGNCEVAWWEGKPGDAVVMAKGGSVEDKILAEKVVAAQLEGFGYRRATFHFAVDATEILDRERSGTDSTDDEGLNPNQRERVIERQDNWNDLVEKAKRLVNTGSVTSVRNSTEFISGVVKGDHGTYESNIMRQDPESSVITGWHCECKWNQFAWQRTRQWKIYEGRPCSHVLALYFVSKMMPTEEEREPKPPEGAPPAPGMAPGAPAPVGELSPFAQPAGDAMPGGVVPSVPEGPRGLQQLAPFKPEDVGATSPDDILQQRLGPLAPKPPEKIQKPPLEQLKEQQRQNQPPAEPGASPYGQMAPPGTVSVPGARQPNHNNPIGLPGVPGFGTYSKVTVREPVTAMTDDSTYEEIPVGTVGKVISLDPVTNLIETEFAIGKTSSVRCYLTGEELELPNV